MSKFDEASRLSYEVNIEKDFKSEDHHYLPVDFENSPELLLSDKNCEKTRNISDGFCPICYSPNIAGPDISIAFFFLKGEKKEAYILNTQVKLKNNVELKKACKTVDLNTMFTDKNSNLNPFQFYNELHEIY
ncbi:8227_t:CDS:2 [Funneliformis mosseae]|uniref:8227_t:CDS:1 n=1 Tax=Funneliformis mosseae TaxID=27381 RepID=A0A9N9F7E2_FUNMO|nr:8227_t:CDS:2 [Funneliformis mosseae]